MADDLVFNTPPGWPPPPEGWRPPQGWQPDPSWPAAPYGWQFWVARRPLPPIPAVIPDPPRRPVDSPAPAAQAPARAPVVPQVQPQTGRVPAPGPAAQPPAAAPGFPARPTVNASRPGLPVIPNAVPRQPNSPTPPAVAHPQPAAVPPLPAKTAVPAVKVADRLSTSEAAIDASRVKAKVDNLLAGKLFLRGEFKEELQAALDELTAAYNIALDELRATYEQDVATYNKIAAVTALASVEAEFAKRKAALQQDFERQRVETQAYIENQMRQFELDSTQRRRQLDQSLSNAEGRRGVLEAKISRLESQLIDVETKAAYEDVSLYSYLRPAENSIKLKAELDDVAEDIRRMARDKTAINFSYGFTFNNSEAEGKKFVNDFVGLMLTAYNQEAENVIVKSEKTRDVTAAKTRLDKASDKIERLGTRLGMSVNAKYHKLRKREIELNFMYKQQLAEEKEAERERARDLREAEREEREARRQAERLLAEERALAREIAARKAELAAKLEADRKAGLAKEGAQLANAISLIDDNDPVLQSLLARQVDVVKAQKETSNLIANIRAGYVYVISNIGSFGEGVVKIGLTRRAVPEERVKELGDASVPFLFDTHILHYSDDAVSLENALHKRFEKQAVNKINARKEFFRVHPEEVRDAMMKLSDGAVLSFEVEPEAADYRSSLKLAEIDEGLKND